VSVSPTRVDVRTPAGVGTADVSVTAGVRRASLPAAYRWASPDVAARWGTVGQGLDDRADVLLVNALRGENETRAIALAGGDPGQIVMTAPPSRVVARFTLYAWPGAPRPATVTLLSHGRGAFAMPPPWVAAAPRPAVVWNNLGSTAFLGVPTLPS